MDAQVLIQIYRTGYYVCAAIAILGFMLAVLFFFRFKIIKIWEARTGRAEKKEVSALQEASKSDGRMRKDEKQHGIVNEELPSEPTEDLEINKITETLVLEQETVLLKDEPMNRGGETVVLEETEELTQTEVLENQGSGFVITQQVLLIHTEERIP